MPRDQDPLGATDTRLDSGLGSGADWADSTDLLVPGLTILWHPDIERVGERVALTGLAAGRAHEVARLTPELTPPGRPISRPLGDSRLSRTPIRLVPAPGGLRIERAGSRTPVEIDGATLDEVHEVDTETLDRGVVVVLGHQVVLLLHRLDPVLPPDLPRHGLVGDSPGIVRLRRDIGRVADLPVSVLLRGETGTGKELVARALHDAGPRRDGPFVAVNMAAIPSTLAAAELFGAEKGAFTGADHKRAGPLRRAHGGTLVLDEIGEAPIEVQALLLRALESGEVQGVGANQPTAVDVRVVSATDLDLEAAIGDQGFRAPLLYRLAGFTMHLPPMRERREDFGRLFRHFLETELEAIGETFRLAPTDRPWLSGRLIARLARHPWPGNVRQLQNTVRQLVIANRGNDRVTILDPLEDLLDDTAPTAVSDPEVADGRRSTRPRPAARLRKPSDIREDELVEALARHHYQIQATADALGIPRGSLYGLIDKSPRVRKASDLGADEIADAIETHGGSIQAAAVALCVSEQALRRRMGQLGMS